MSEIQLHQFADRIALGKELAVRVAGALEAGIEKRGKAVLAVSGGSTPGKFFEILSKKTMRWENVIVTLVDERWVDGDNERSNGRLVRKNLLVNEAARAKFVPLYNGPGNIDELIVGLENKFQQLPMPFAATVLGMGNDGHTASFFPGGDNLDGAVDPNTEHLLSSMRAAGAGEARITFTLPVLIQADFLALHIEGEEKLQVLDEARKKGDGNAMPIRHILNARSPLEVFWTP